MFLRPIALFVLAGACLATSAAAQRFDRGPVLRIGLGGIQVELGSCAPRGHYESRMERVWVPGCERVVQVPARFAWRRDSCGRRTRVCVEPARTRIVREPGRYEWRERRVFVAHR
ncbi:MAG: hypothetical protein O2865_15985 [Planctomycetota bacterium]|nr:hypothetical protein [Planctomycetota bacterium]MDA0932621.1 hypothetical protein [Planctomycetota bacterium]MDA1220615.1 hypothetical protein [Planctomycetota bacterium]